MSTKHAKQTMAELMGLRAATVHTDAKLRGAAERIADHHSQRAARLRERIPAAGARTDDLEDEYLDSVYEADIAGRY